MIKLDQSSCDRNFPIVLSNFTRPSAEPRTRSLEFRFPRQRLRNSFSYPHSYVRSVDYLREPELWPLPLLP
jgi:hypothetical protein